jgi:ribosomal-protein-alanine N-acetyltransferase
MLFILPSTITIMDRPVIAEGEKVVLVPMEMEDVDFFYKMINDIRISRFVTGRTIYTRKEEEEFISSELKNRNAVHLTVLDKNGQRVGKISFWTGFNQKDRTAEVGYWIAPEYWGKGYATEAVGLVCEIAFVRYNLRRLYARVRANNVGSQRVLEKNGFKKEGRLRKHEYDPADGKYYDVYIYGLLRKEWERVRKDV